MKLLENCLVVSLVLLQSAGSQLLILPAQPAEKRDENCQTKLERKFTWSLGRVSSLTITNVCSFLL